MNILYIGAGFVGACSAAVAAESGHQVLVYDIDEKKAQKFESGDCDLIESCLPEKGLGDMLIKNKKQISFVGDYTKIADFVDDCDAIFLCLPTPEIKETGETDLSFYTAAAEKLAESLKKRNGGQQTRRVVIINKSTVPIDMLTRTKEILDKADVKNYGIVSNPEFLVEGKAIEGSLNPARVVIGAECEDDFAVMREIYQRFHDSPSVQYIEVNPREAAAGKLLANFYLSIKLSACFDVFGRVCEAFEGLKFENIKKIMASDQRIGEWGFLNSLYAGGSCLIKDARSLAYQLKVAGKNNDLIMETFLANKRQLEIFIGRAEKEAGVDWSGKNVAILGLSFKSDTNDIRNSPAIDIVEFIKQHKIGQVCLYDPAAMENFKVIFPDSPTIVYCDNEKIAVENADIIIIAADWPQFKNLGSILPSLKKRPLIMDGRRMLVDQFEELQNLGYDIIAVGSPFLKGK